MNVSPPSKKTLRVPVYLKGGFPILVLSTVQDIIRKELADSLDGLSGPFSDFIEADSFCCHVSEYHGKSWDVRVEFKRDSLLVWYSLNARYLCKISVPYPEPRPTPKQMCDLLHTRPKKVVIAV